MTKTVTINDEKYTLRIVSGTTSALNEWWHSDNSSQEVLCIGKKYENYYYAYALNSFFDRQLYDAEEAAGSILLHDFDMHYDAKKITNEIILNEMMGVVAND